MTAVINIDFIRDAMLKVEEAGGTPTDILMGELAYRHLRGKISTSTGKITHLFGMDIHVDKGMGGNKSTICQIIDRNSLYRENIGFKPKCGTCALIGKLCRKCR